VGRNRVEVASTKKRAERREGVYGRGSGSEWYKMGSTGGCNLLLISEGKGKGWELKTDLPA